MRIGIVTSSLSNTVGWGRYSFEIVNELRTKFRNSDIEYKVVKNSLTKIALKDMPFNIDEVYLKLPTGIAFSYKDSLSPIKLLNDFIKTHEKPRIKGSIRL